MPKQITQAELRTVLDNYAEAADAATDIRQRINDGSGVEPGRLSANSDGSADPNLSDYESLCLNGLSIQPVLETMPDWLNTTPENPEFVLTVILPGGDHEQCIDDLTRGEFIGLKRHLAKLRGYAVPEVPMPKTVKKLTAPKLTIAKPEPLPDWLVEMPWDAEYNLTMSEGGMDCQDCQTVQITRSEYISLKLHLAGLRGIIVPETQPEQIACDVPTLWSELESEEIAAANRASKLVASEVSHA